MAVKLRLCEAGDIEYIAANMRAVDAEEIRLAGNHDPLECLTKGASHSVYCRVIEINGRPAAILGLVPLDNVNGRGICWLLGTDDIERHAKAFCELCRQELAAMMKRAERVENFVWAENRVSIRWLKWLGFEFEHQEIVWGPEKARFLHFYKEKEVSKCVNR